MAMQLESDIMAEIGLGQHYYYYNSSGSCEYIRKEAARRLPEVIQKWHDSGKEVAPPNHRLLNLLKAIAQWGDESQYVLTHTWKAASYVIASHIHAFYEETEEAKAAEFQHVYKYLSEHYTHEAPKTRYDFYDFPRTFPKTFRGCFGSDDEE